MRRDVGRHTDSNAARAVDQQVREDGRHDARLGFLAIIVRDEVDRVLADVRHQAHRRLGHAAFGVAHGRRRIVVDRTEVALAIDQHQPHRKGLRHPDQCVVDRLVAVRVEAGEHIADRAGRFRVGLVGRHADVEHRIQDATVDGLEAVPHIRKRARDDHAHRVIEVGFLQFGRDGDWRNLASSVRAFSALRGGVVWCIGQAGNVRVQGGQGSGLAAGIRSRLLAHFIAATQTFRRGDPQPRVPVFLSLFGPTGHSTHAAPRNGRSWHNTARGIDVPQASKCVPQPP